MGKMQRTKGAAYEREVAKILSERLGRPTKRMLGQARDGGHDLEQIGPWLFECKRRAKIAVYDWIHQIAKAATGTWAAPIVIARADNEQSIVIMRLDDWLDMARAVLEREKDRAEAVSL